MSLLGGLLPIIEEKENSRPITASLEPHLIDNFLREQARLERLSQSTINPPNAKRLYLEPITPEIFDLYGYINEDTPMTDATDSELCLFPAGKFNIMDDSDVDEDTFASPETPLLKLDLSAYRKRREETNERIKRLVAMSRQEETAKDVIAPPVTATITAPLALDQTTSKQPETIPVLVSEQPEVANKEVSNEPLQSIPTMITAMKRPAITPTTAWFDKSQIDTSNIESSKKLIYAYADGMIPIFTTSAQQLESEALGKSSSAQAAMFFNMHFERAINTLNNPSVMVDASSQEKWLMSGKYLFLQELLTSLEQQNLTICIITKDMDDEARLLDLMRDHLKLDCLRITTALDVWDGEYGVLVRTRKLQERISSCADLMICMDVRISRDNDVFDKIKNNNGERPPVVWLISLGSVESKAYNYLKDHNTTFTISKSNKDFKNLIMEPNEWPPSNCCEEMNIVVVNNVLSWLLTKPSADYQYRSITYLPQSYPLGSLSPEKTSIPEVVDMDISSDSELVNLTSMNTYIEKVNESNTKTADAYDYR
jgi:hypothetical protein